MENNIGPKGYVILKDKKTGNVLREGSNMILKAGREYILSMFIEKNSNIFSGSISESITDSEFSYISSLKDYTLDSLLFSADDTDNEYLYDYVDLLDIEKEEEWNYRAFFNFNKTDDSDSNYLKNYLKMYPAVLDLYDGVHLRLKLQVDLSLFSSSSDEQTFSSLNIILSNTENNEKKYKIFSRFCFDPISLENDSDISMTYYIYF